MLFTPVAFQIPLVDAGGYYTQNNVESAMQQVGLALTGYALSFTTVGNITSTQGDITATLGDIIASAGDVFAGGNVGATGSVTGANLSGTNTGDQTITLTGDVTGSGTGSFAATIANNAVTNAKAAQMATQTIKGRTTAGTGNAEDLTAAQAATIVQGDGLDVDMCGYRGVPQTSFSADTTIAALHCGRTLYHPATDANARTLTIDSNANLALEIGFTFTVINDTSQVVTLAITADTLVWAGVGSTGSRSLAQYAEVTVTKVTATRWFVTGVGIT